MGHDAAENAQVVILNRVGDQVRHHREGKT